MAKYLDRKAVLKVLKTLLADENDYSDLYHDGYVDGVYDAEDAVKGLPSVNVQPSTPGQLIGIDYDGFADGNPVFNTWKCSKCGHIFEGEDIDLKFCSNCGVRFKKDGEQDG